MTANNKYSHLRQHRIETLFKDCQDAVINQMLGAFGLNRGMFVDRDGGSVTTLRNFSRDDDKFVAERDKEHYAESSADYERAKYVLNEGEKKDGTYTPGSWGDKKQKHKSPGIDAYTGKAANPEDMDLDHRVPLKREVTKPKNHLAFKTGTQEGIEDLKQIVNDDINLSPTAKTINRSKGQKTNSEYLDGPIRQENESDQSYAKKQAQHQKRLDDNQVDPELMREKEEQAQNYLESEANKRLFKKQSSELLATGAEQFKAMALKQALGMMLTELVSIVFAEAKTLVNEGVELSIEMVSKLKDRVLKRAKQLINKAPAILGEGVKGGVSGFGACK